MLIFSDIQRALDFPLRVLGFVDPAVHGDPPCFAMLNRDGFDLMLSLGTPRPNGRDGVWDVHLRVDDLAAEMEVLAAAGVPLDVQPHETFYGMREIEILDPDGHRWCLGQDLVPRDSQA